MLDEELTLFSQMENNNNKKENADFFLQDRQITKRLFQHMATFKKEHKCFHCMDFVCSRKNRIKNHKPMHDSNAYNLKGNVKISGLISHHMQNKTAEVKKISNVSKECLCDHLISALPLPSSCFCYSNQPHHPHLFSCVFPPP